MLLELCGGHRAELIEVALADGREIGDLRGHPRIRHGGRCTGERGGGCIEQTKGLVWGAVLGHGGIRHGVECRGSPLGSVDHLGQGALLAADHAEAHRGVTRARPDLLACRAQVRRHGGRAHPSRLCVADGSGVREPLTQELAETPRVLPGEDQ